MQVLPLANPLRVAEEAAIVDHISHGRLVFGVGRSSFLESYQGYNVDYEESRALFFESLEIIQRAWRDTPLPTTGTTITFMMWTWCPSPISSPIRPFVWRSKVATLFSWSGAWDCRFSSDTRWTSLSCRGC